MFDNYIKVLEKHKLAVFIIVFSTYIGLSLFSTKIELASSFRAFFNDNNPKVQIFDEMETEFNKNDSIVIHVINPNGSIFNKTTLSLIADLTESSWSIPYSIRVDSLANYQYTEVDGDDLDTIFLIEDKHDLEKPSNIARIKRISEEEDTIHGVLVGSKQASSLISITVNRQDNNKAINAEIYTAALNLIDSYQKKYPQHDFLLSGSVSSSAAITQAMKSDMSIIALATLLVVTLMLAVLLKTYSGVFIVLFVSLLSITATFGFFGLMGITITPTHAFAPTAICTIAVADLVHILSTYYHQIHTGNNKNSAIHEALKLNWSPIFITTISTMVGALCLNSSDSPPYQTLGNMIAFGVFSAYLLSISLVPVLLSWLPLPKRYLKSDSTFQGSITHIGKLVIKYRKAVLITMILCCTASTLLISKNRVTERWYEYFAESTQINIALNDLDNDYSGIHKIHYTVKSNQGEHGIHSPSYLADLDLFATWLRQQPQVGFVEVHTSTIKKMNKNLHGGDPAYLTIPSNKQEVAQYLLLYEMSLPIGLGLDHIQNSDQSASKITVLLHKLDSEELIKFDQQAIAWLRQNTQHILVDEGTGMDLIFAYLSGSNIRNIISGSLAGLILIACILSYALSSFKLGMISLIPNLLPLLIAYGIWGLIDGKISVAVSVVMSISLGIIVDDTVHFLSKYQYAKKHLAYNTEQAIDYVFITVGPALVITTLVLVCGFLLMLLASFSPSQAMGLLLSMVLAIALLVDFLLLPILMLLMDSRQPENNPAQVLEESYD